MLNRSFLLILALALPTSPARAFEAPTSVREALIDIDVDVDSDVTDPRGDESPNPREDDFVCDNVVCGDEGPKCVTCGKPAQ